MNNELAKRLECIKRTLAEMQDVVSKYNEPSNGVQSISSNDWELLTRSITDCEIALDLNDSEPIENDWYGLFSNDIVNKLAETINNDFWVTDELHNEMSTNRIKGLLVNTINSIVSNDVVSNDYGYIRTELIMDISTELTPIIFKETTILDDMGITAYRGWIVEMVDKFLYDKEGEFMKWCALPSNKKEDYFYDKYRIGLDEWLNSEMKDIIFNNIVLEDYLDVEIESSNIDEWRVENKKQRLQDENYSKIETMIEDLKAMEVDGETMEYIIREVGMDEQMLNQLKVLYGEMEVDSETMEYIIRGERYYMVRSK